MPRSLSDLANDLDALAFELPREVASNLAERCALVILNDLLNVTPVDTSRAMSNWQVSLDAPVSRQIPAHYVGERGSSAAASKTAALQAARAILGTKKPGQTIYVGNALPYIRRLNDGHSKQAPAGFIDRAILLGRLFAQNPSSFDRVL